MWVNTYVEALTSPNGVQLESCYTISNATACYCTWERTDDGPNAWVPLTHKQVPKEIMDFLFGPASALGTVGI